ncbi:UNVERIFIED_CONTAM: hypothetical protein GTU68_058654 [Idotea baltica]|nr:hypothetical protein [Idotea baltica]
MTSKSKRQRKCTEILRFYLTAFFILLAALSSLAFVFLVPFVIDPGFSTLFAEFDPNPLTCVTVESVFKFGLSNCSWSSCREGCTRDVFRCTQIYVNYFRDTEGLLYKYAKIFPNVKGCGYPPQVNCTEFNKRYSDYGTTFTCYYSQLQPNVTITELNLEEIKESLIYAIAAPWGCFIASVLYLLITYVGMKKPDLEYSDEPEDISSKASKEASNYSLRSISKTINQGMSRLRGEPDDKG